MVMATGSPASWRESCVLPSGPAGARAAREMTRGCLRGWGVDDPGGEVILAVSELAANACVHGLPPVVLGLALDAGPAGAAVTCRVSDANPELPSLAAALAADAESGRGLVIVAALASRVWTEPCAHGKAVCCRFDLRPAATPAAAAA